MEWLLLLLAGGAIGVPGSMIATYLSARIEVMRSRKRFSIEGVWGEYIEDSKGRQFTLGKIYWDNKRKIFAFDGTNFENSGAPFCHFKTTSSSFDLDAGKFLYTFEAQIPAKPNELYFGFGVVNLERHDRDEATIHRRQMAMRSRKPSRQRLYQMLLEIGCVEPAARDRPRAFAAHQAGAA